MKKLSLCLLVALLSACTSIVKVEGDQVVNGRMAVRLTDAWNKVSLPGAAQPFETWTQEGLPLDHLRFWAAIPTGKSLMTAPRTNSADQKAPRVPTYLAGMQPDQLVNLFEILYSNDGSIVTLSKVEPATFVGEKGVHFAFSMTRKSDGVEMKGIGWLAVHKGELFAASFVAPKKSFFPRLAPKAESVAKSAKVQG
jgi:hypothetical protein